MRLIIQYPLKTNYFGEKPYLIGANSCLFGEILIFFGEKLLISVNVLI